MTDRRTTVATTELEAECLRCPWRTTAANGHGNAARHHDATGHPVIVRHTRQVTYGDPHEQPAGQATLDLEAAGA